MPHAGPAVAMPFDPCHGLQPRPLADRGHRRALQPRNRRSPVSSGVDLGVVWIACIEVSRRGGFACMTVLEHDRNVRAAEAIGTGQSPVAGMERR